MRLVTSVGSGLPVGAEEYPGGGGPRRWAAKDSWGLLEPGVEGRRRKAATLSGLSVITAGQGRGEPGSRQSLARVVRTLVQRGRRLERPVVAKVSGEHRREHKTQAREVLRGLPRGEFRF